ncbi:hypothetical protein pdam_00012876 [Pocillopora damicornis]|uniref:Apple domain-containing protein n=1 Tax=Pocillopora damicornis TaxID=46731 RepID=A0A3M6UYS2_POCDA|nr:hypothetical protein pdam_00012876 [Pocillopora damicornis]
MSKHCWQTYLYDSLERNKATQTERLKKTISKREWGEWRTRSPTCGIGQRSRERCQKKTTKKCPPHKKTTQTKQCGSVSCALTSVSVQVWSSRENKRPLSLGTTSSKVFMTSRYDLMTPDRAMTSRHLAITSSGVMMTSASVPGVTMLSTQINKVLSSPFLMLPRTSVAKATPGNEVLSKTEPSPTSSLHLPEISTSMAVMLSSSSMTSPLLVSSSTILESPALVIASSPVSKTADRKSPKKTNQGPMESPSSLHAYFKTVRKDWILLNHQIKRLWTSSEISCAMVCMRHQNCQSFNFKCSEKYSDQLKDVDTKQGHNCQLNSAKHSTSPGDFVSKKGYCYFYL